ncbi:MAG: hypothetical protein H7333_06220 [Bdellovibrionales bacterium]|nr:hypothetical protein [Oligoflexia bacterium]
MSILPFFILLILSTGNQSSAQAEIGVSFSQSSNFWGLVSEIRNGGKNFDSANRILNDTYGHPEGDQIGIVFQNPSVEPSFKLKEFKVEQIGYAFATNPVLPTLYTWVGVGPSATLAYRSFEFFGGHYWAKYVNAASTDLIDRPLLQSDEISFAGLGFNHEAEIGDSNSFPTQLGFHSRHAYFLSNLLESEWVNRFNIDAVTKLSANWNLQLILGPAPVPTYEKRSLLWDYLWKNDLSIEALGLIGTGVDFQPSEETNLHFLAGFYGGYFGGSLHWVHSAFKLSVFTYGYETSSAFQGRELRLFGANLNLIL